MIDPDCRTCRGSGLVAPSPFYNDYQAWPDWLSDDWTIHEDMGWSIESSATAMGSIRPIACPRCNAGGDVASNPWAIRVSAVALNGGPPRGDQD